MKKIGYISVHCTDHCNNHCRDCNHFAPFAEPREYMADEYFSGLDALADKGYRVDFLSILGGEPFLHTRLDEFVTAMRSRYPDTMLHLATNGFWLSRNAMRRFETVFRTVQQLAISIYPNMIKRLGGPKNAAALIVDLRVAYPSMRVVPRFQTTFSVRTAARSGRIVTEPACGQIHCTALLADGRLSRCPAGAYRRFSRQDMSFFASSRDVYFDTAIWPEQLETWLARRSLDACAYCPYAVTQTAPWKAERGIPYKQDLVDEVFARIAG